MRVCVHSTADNILVRVVECLTVLRISGIASHFAPQIQANAMQQHFCIALIAMQNNARIIALSSANLPLTFGSD